MSYLIVGIGGIFGSITRFTLGRYIGKKSKGTFPIGTYIINISGAIILGIVSSLRIETNVYLLLADGFLGSYTTFSTFMYEGFNLLREKENINAIIYITSSVILGVIGYIIGIKFGKIYL